MQHLTRPLVFLLTIVAAVVLLSGPATVIAGPGEDSETGARLLSALPVTANTTYKTFAGSDFKLLDSTDSVNYIINGVIEPSGETADDWRARVILPAGAAITEVTFIVLDNDPANSALVCMLNYEAATQGFQTIGTFSTAGSAAAFQTINLPIVAAVATVDHQARSYSLGWDPGAVSTTLRLAGARIGFTVGTAVGTQYETYAGIDFLARDATVPFDRTINGSVTVPSGTVGLLRRIDLPHGARVTEVLFYVVDNSAAANARGLFTGFRALARASTTVRLPPRDRVPPFRPSPSWPPSPRPSTT